MPSLVTDFEGLLIRHTALSVIVQGLLDTMLVKGLLVDSDLHAIRSYAMDLSQDLLDFGSAEARTAGVRLGDEVKAFINVVVGDAIGPGDGTEVR